MIKLLPTPDGRFDVFFAREMIEILEGIAERLRQAGIAEQIIADTIAPTAAYCHLAMEAQS